MKYSDLTFDEKTAWERMGGEEVFIRQNHADECFQHFAASVSGGRALNYGADIFPDYYGGAYIDTNGELVVFMKSDTEKSRNDLYERMDSKNIEVVSGRHSFNELLSTQRVLMGIKPSVGEFSDEFIDNFVGCELRDKENCLYVMLKQVSENTPLIFEQNGFSTDLGLRFMQVHGVPEDYATLYCGAQAPYGSSMGYRARLDGNNGFVTTAHGVPAKIGSTVYASAGTSSPIGTVEAWNRSYGADAAFIRTNANYTPSNTINSGGTLGISLWEPVSGALIYAVGKTTGLRSGTVNSTSYAYYDTDGVGWVLISSTDLGGDTGDSGGLVYRVISGGNYAAGIFKGRSYEGQYVFSKASTVNSYLSVSRY